MCSIWQDDHKSEVVNIAKRMVKINQDFIGEQYIRNHDGVRAVSEEDRKTAWKSYHEKILNPELGIK